MDLFDDMEEGGGRPVDASEPGGGAAPRPDDPLAYRMCPRDLDEFTGQEHILGEGRLLRRAIEADRISSIVLYGPPGVGKTALARVIARRTRAAFHWLNAATAGLDELRKIIKRAREARGRGRRTILFLDEIHRFNKLQQDALLPDVEEGSITLIAATVENPFFYVNAALLSRSQVFELKGLGEEDLLAVLRRAIKDEERGFGSMEIEAEEEALRHLARTAEGDARRALTALEVAVLTTEPGQDGRISLTRSQAEDSIQKKAILYDRAGDAHYDTISAFIKSMRGSDPDATVYWLAKMLAAGEDPRFVARRIVIAASEDIGEADPQALVLATATLRAVEFVGMPEARIPLSQAAIYLANAPKSNACYRAIEEAMRDVESESTQEVPDHLKDAHYGGAKKLGHGEGYLYPHNYEGGWVRQRYMPNDKRYYHGPNRRAPEEEVEGEEE